MNKLPAIISVAMSILSYCASEPIPQTMVRKIVPENASKTPTLPASDDQPSLGLPFDEGTEGEWCEKACAQIWRPQKQGDIIFAAFRITDDDFRGGKEEYVRNMIECPAKPHPVYVNRIGKKRYQMFFCEDDQYKYEDSRQSKNSKDDESEMQRGEDYHGTSSDSKTSSSKS